MTPLEIEILLHYHSKGGDYKDGDRSAPAVLDAINTFTGVTGLLEYDYSTNGRSLKMTEKGHVYVKKICSISLPKVKWVFDDIN